MNEAVRRGVWLDDTSPVQVEDFTEDIGPTRHGLEETANPFDYLSLILTESFYDTAAEETNNYVGI